MYNYYRNRKRNYRQKEFWRKGPALKSPFFVINPIVIIIKGESQRFLNFPLTILSILSKFMQWTTVKNCHFLFLAFLLRFVVFLYVLCALLHSVFLYDVLLLHGFRLYVVMIWNIKEPFLWCNQWWFQQLVPDDVKSNKIENILVYRPSYRHNRKVFIVTLITYIYIWQRFERYFSRYREKIDLYSFYSKISFIPIWIQYLRY